MVRVISIGEARIRFGGVLLNSKPYPCLALTCCVRNHDCTLCVQSKSWRGHLNRVAGRVASLFPRVGVTRDASQSITCSATIISTFMTVQELQQTQERINTIFNVIAHHRRRYALRELQRHEKPMALADLADEIAVRENEAAITDIPAEEVKRIYMSLYHTHIPKLAEASLVHYDQERDTVVLIEDAEQIEQ